MVLETPQPHAPVPRRVKFWMLGLALLGGLWLCGLVLLVSADGHFEVVLPRTRTPPAEFHNFSLWDLGPTIRASSFFADWEAHHHPAFLVDGRTWPSKVEKWTSAERDRHPWVEITWREKHDLERVVIRHAGSVEWEAMTAHCYTLRCLTDGEQGPSLEVMSNQDAVAAHDLVCPQARGLRIEFVPNDSKDIIRVFEVETWGR
jgi:hypothetical protein